MTLPISLTCKTQEPSRTRTLRGTRGTSTGEARGGGGREGGTDRPPALTGPGCWTRWWCLQQTLEQEDEPPPQLWPPHSHLGGVPGAMKGPFWIKPAPQHAAPAGGSKPSLLGPSSCLAVLCCPLHLPSLPDPGLEIPVSLVVGGWRRGCQGGRQPRPSSPPPQPPAAWRSSGLLSHGRGAPGEEGMGHGRGLVTRGTRRAALKPRFQEEGVGAGAKSG